VLETIRIASFSNPEPESPVFVSVPISSPRTAPSGRMKSVTPAPPWMHPKKQVESATKIEKLKKAKRARERIMPPCGGFRRCEDAAIGTGKGRAASRRRKTAFFSAFLFSNQPKWQVWQS
jgi:hypothetical protein